MKISWILLTSLICAATIRSQVVNFDSLFAQAQQHHTEGMRLFAALNNAKALEEFNLATEKFRDFQDGLPNIRDSVIRMFEKLQTNDPQSPVYNYLLGRIIQISQPDSAQATFAVRCLNKAAEIEPNYPWTYLALAYPLTQSKNYAAAAQYYEKAIAADSSFMSGYTQLISTYKHMGRNQDAQRVEDLLMLKYPHSPTSVTMKLEKARGETDYNTKIKVYRDAIALSEDDNVTASAYSELLNAFYIRYPDSATALARKVLKLFDKQYRRSKQTAYVMLFRAAAKQGVSAVDALADEVITTTDPFILRTIGVYYLDSLENDRKALPLLERAYEVCTKDNALNALIVGSLLTDQRLEDVAKNFRVWVAYDLGLLHLNLKQDEKAEQYLTQAAIGTTSEHVIDANFKLGFYFMGRHDSEKAIEWLSRGLALQGNDETMKQLVSLVGSEKQANAMVEKLRRISAPLAKDFKLLSIDGDYVRLSDLRGKVVVIDFWATWCGPCIREMPHLQKMVEKYTNNSHVKFLSISTDNPQDPVRPFIEKNKYTMKVLYDGGAGLAYEVRGIPSLFLVDGEGKIQYKHVGFGGNGEEFIKMMSAEIDELLAFTPSSK